MKNNTEIIGKYLQNEMTADERNAFEKQMAGDKELQQQLAVQKQILVAIETAGLKNSFAKAIRIRFISRMLIRWGIVAIVVAGLVYYAFTTNIFSHGERESINSVSGTESFIIDNAADTIIETDEGVVFGIPANAFNSENKKIRLEIKTAISPDKIMLHGLSTTSNGSLLQTAGMFYINAYDNNKPVSLIKKIDVSVPTKKVNPAMQLFDGVQDSSGRINWVNPKPIEKRLRTYDITSLDFYPPDYIPVLKALEKDYTNKKYTDSLYYSFSGLNYRYPEGAPQYYLKESETAKADTSIKSDDFLNPQPDSSKSARYWHPEIDPSRIRTIWDSKFNNTILATKEFEERLQFIHGLCNADYLKAYFEALDTPMYVIDQVCADNSTGEVRKKFLDFAARKDGGVMIKEGMQEKLSAYFENKFKAYRDASVKTWAKYEQELSRLAAIADNKRRGQETRNFLREDKNLQEEFCANLTDAYRQIGVKRSCIDTIPTPPPANYYNIQIDTVGWKNLDVYVFEATEGRESMTYTDPSTGKTATVTYKEVDIHIENQHQFDKVWVYLLPDGLASFQRIELTSNTFKEKLNMLFRYDAVAIGFKGDQAYHYRQPSLQPGQYTFRLTAINDKQLKQQLKTSSNDRSEEMLNEFEYQLFRQQEIRREVQLRKELDFRNQVMRAIWNCARGPFSETNVGPVAAPADTTAVK